MTTYGDIDLGHQAITWTNVDLSSIRSSDIHLRAILQKISQPPIIKISFEITHIKFHSNLPGGQWVNTYLHWPIRLAVVR